jgi:hypothetical protein
MKKKEDVSIKGKINLALIAFISGFILNLIMKFIKAI